MNFRYARHTSNLASITAFYMHIVRLVKQGGFSNHNQYDGVFLGMPDHDWQLEFTMSDELPQSNFDEDDILVFYFNSALELSLMRKHLNQNNIKIEIPKNPYWAIHGIQISDPDGYKIVFSKLDIQLNSNDGLTQLIRSKSIITWSDLLEYVKNLPYGRNANREDFSLVIKESKGTCSSKHALLKKVADNNNIKNVKLVISIYKMNQHNTPGISNILTDNDLDYIPEAHCYLKINNQILDVTSSKFDLPNIDIDIMNEIEITPEQVSQYKIEYHKNFLENWINVQGLNISLTELWDIREQCINRLAEFGE